MLKRVVKRKSKEKYWRNLNNKGDRGLSTIVATLLVILLTLVAVGIIWVVIRNVIQQSAEQISLGKFTLNLEIEDVTTDSATPANINVKIKRNVGEGTISGLNFIFDDGDTTEVVKLVNFSLNELEERTINISLKSITNSSKILKVSVAPIFRLESGKDVTGDVKDEYEMPKTYANTCVPNCVNKNCGSNGCGGSCGSCGAGYSCNANGTCMSTACIPNCIGKNCGSDGCTGNCGTCTSPQTCNANGTCMSTACIPNCIGKNCGSDGCTGNCGTCTSPQTCNATGICSTVCIPNCIGKNCGSDGCTGNCGTCTSPQTCTNFVCVNPVGNCGDGICSGETCSSCPGDCGACSGHTYYLSPSGNDNTGNGSITRPWFTLEKAWNVVSAGDTIYMRGGTYEYSEQTLRGKSGSAGNLIKVWAFPEETPIITKSSTGSYDQPRALIHIPNGDYLHFRGLELSYFEQENQYLWSCLWVFNSENSIFEQLNIHHCGMGALLENTDNCLVLNSDFHHNSDPLTSYDVYGNADGLGMSGDYGKTNTIRGCRFWWNTDDGIDLYGVEGNVIIEDSWAWNNGFVPDTFNDGGDGNGFKLGDTFTSRPTTVLRTVTNSVAFHNKMFGFHDNDAKCNMELYNNIAYQNCYMGYESWCGGFHFVMPGAPYYIKNNIAYNNLGEDVALDVLTNVNHNSWDLSVTVTNSDFLSVSFTGIDGPRQSDGSLPNINFLQLASGSDLIDKGVNVGLPFSGNYPDLGAYETNY